MRASALRLLAGREHSRAELRHKLWSRAQSDHDVDSLLEELASDGLQSDERFAEQYVRQRRAKGFGPVRITAELRERGIAEELAMNWLDLEDSVWREAMLLVARQKFGFDPAREQREKARRARFLEYRGFPAELIHQYLSE